MSGSPAPAAATTAAPPSARSTPSPFSVDLSVDRTAVTIGDPVRLSFRMRYAKGVEVVSFDADRSLAALTLLDQTETPPKAMEDGRVEVTRVVTLAAYETGSKAIDPVRIVYRDAAKHEDAVSTAPITINVASVLTAGQTDPADIKPPVGMPENLLWPWIALAAVVVAAALLAWWWRRRRRRAPETVIAAPAAPPRPAHEIAYAELERLLASGLLERGEVKKFYIELAEILRRYLAARFGIDTLDRTTYEILAELGAVRPPIVVTDLATESLGFCDLVKFAKLLPDREETRRAVERAYRLVDEAKVVAAPPMAPETGGVPGAPGGPPERTAVAAGRAS
jgi:oxygen tolerance protein BatD